MGFRNTIAASDLEASDLSVSEKLVAGFRTDAESSGHLIDVEHVRVLFEHQVICVFS